MKKAYLVTFVTTTRVTVDVPEDFDVHNCNLVVDEYEKAWDSIVKEARENILENPENYLYGDNVEIEEDKECPYGTFEGD
jgi:hypothetical protein